jgi:hypothetical protein
MPNPTPKHPPVKLTKTYVDKVKPGEADCPSSNDLEQAA